MKKSVGLYFIVLSLLCLFAGMFFGNLASLQYLLPDFLKSNFPFTKIRPLHVTLVMTWIFNGAAGCIYYFIPSLPKKREVNNTLAKLHLIAFIITGVIILYSYFTGQFGGKEYMEYPPWIAFFVLLSWILFAINYFLTCGFSFRETKVYRWMWATGIIFFIITFGEAFLWTLPFFSHNIIRETTVQWKAMGAMAGSWNMLIYGSGFYLMEKISGNDSASTSKISFFFYFLGLTNLMFNWGHHTYIVPAAPGIRITSYAISMTELLVIGSIIWNWKKSLLEKSRHDYHISIHFLKMADYWIFLNLILAIVISIPGINHYTHGTHITVAHAMGATIGINSMILLAAVFYIATEIASKHISQRKGRLIFGIRFFNTSLILFWISLIAAGLRKISGEIASKDFSTIMEMIHPWILIFSIAGAGIFMGLAMILTSFPFSTFLKTNSRM